MGTKLPIGSYTLAMDRISLQLASMTSFDNVDMHVPVEFETGAGHRVAGGGAGCSKETCGWSDGEGAALSAGWPCAASA